MKLHDAKQIAHAILDTNRAVTLEVIHDVLNFKETDPNSDEVYVTERLWEDTGLKPMLSQQLHTVGARELVWEHVRTPTTNVDILKARQASLVPEIAQSSLRQLANLEKDVLWLFTLPKLEHAWPLNLLFPTAFGLKLINRFPLLLEGFHMYKCFASPYMNFMTPLSSIIAPWVYIRRNLKWMISFFAYCKMLATALGAGFRVTGNLSNDISRVVSILVYVTLFLYTAVQSFETAALLRKIRTNLKAKLSSIQTFVSVAQKVVSATPPATFKAWGMNKEDILCEDIIIHIQDGMAGLYKLMTDDVLRERIKKLVKAVYILDINAMRQTFIKTKLCVPCDYTTTHTKIWNMGHILLPKHQIRNPISLQKNLIITGPNAAGKTTYIKALFTNIILAQSLGIVCGIKAHIRPVHAIGTFIRVTDTLGKASLFEAEAQRCADIIQLAERTSKQGHAGIFFLDEPMHSTPPLEGMTTCRAVLEYLSELEGIRTITTTHYIDVTDVTQDLSDKFINLSMTAQVAKDGAFTFPYKIQRGPSAQCIALELLQDHQLPEAVITRAIDLKNKLCTTNVNDET